MNFWMCFFACVIFIFYRRIYFVAFLMSLSLLNVSVIMILFAAEPHSSVGSVAHLRTEGRWVDPGLGQYTFQD